MSKIAGKFFQIFVYILIILLIVFIIGIARDCSRNENFHSEGNSGGDTLDVAILYGPESLYLYSDTLSGLNKELIRNFSKDMNIPVKIWPISNISQGMEKIENGSFDILASLPLDHKIKERFLTSESLFFDRLVLIQLKDSVSGSKIINSSLDLEGKKISIASGSPAIQRLKNLSEEIGGNIEIQEEEGLSDELLCLKVAAGAIPFAVVNERVAKNIINNYPYLSFDNPVSFTQFQVYIFNPQDSIIYHQFQDWFESFKNTEIYKSLIL